MTLPTPPPTRDVNDTPTWLIGVSDQDSQARAQTYDAIAFAIRIFNGVADPANSEFSARQVAGTYSKRVAQACSIYLDLLHNLLFRSPERVFDYGKYTEKYLVQLYSYLTLSDLALFLARLAQSKVKSELPTEPEVVDFLRQWMRDAADALPGEDDAMSAVRPSSEKAAIKRWQENLLGLEKSFADATDAAESASVAVEFAEEAGRARDAARMAAGQTGTATLGGHFRQVAEQESSKAFRWTFAAFVFVAIVIGAGALIVKNVVNDNWLETLIHLVIVLPVIAAASYCAKIAGHHRLLSRWAKTASVQVDSIGAFAEQLETALARQELILGLGKNIFSAPVFDDRSANDKISAIPPELLDTLRDLVRKLPDKP